MPKEMHRIQCSCRCEQQRAWSAQVYQATGKLVAVTTAKVTMVRLPRLSLSSSRHHCLITLRVTGVMLARVGARAYSWMQVVPSDATFEDYLQLSTAEDRSVSIPIGE